MKLNEVPDLARFESFVRINQFTLLYFLLLVLIFGLARVAFIVAHGAGTFDPHFLLDTFYWGIRIDSRSAAVICLLPYLLAQIAAASEYFHFRILLLYYKHVTLLLLIISLLLVVINHFYYQNFQNHIDIFLFEFLDWENTKAVSLTIWQDYPVISVLLLLGAGCWLSARVLNSFLLLSAASSWLHLSRLRAATSKTVYVLFSLLLLFLLARGSVSTFPLTLTQISIAGDLLLTRAVANGPMAFVESFAEWLEMKRLKPVSDERFQQAYATWFEKPYREGDDVFISQASIPLLQADLPNVVVMQMESFGEHVAALHTEQNQLLGEFAKHRDEDYWFTNFLSSTKGTLNTLEKLLSNTGLRNISQSSYRKTPFPTSPAAVFKRLGYHTVFLTGGSKTWSNIDQFLMYQGFDDILDAEDIRLHFPAAEYDGAWGVFDAHTFRYVSRLLEQKTGKPVFIYVVTMTNHSPYTLPEDYDGRTFTVPKAYKTRVIKGDMQKAALVLKTYHYSSNELGLFMNRLKASEQKNRTIVAATGDHYMRDLFNYYIEPSDLMHQYRVPLYLYVPETFKTAVHYESQRMGSHKDIFPTIFARLSSAQPLRSGSDMLAAEHQQAIAISEEFTMSAEGAVLNIAEQPLFYQWQGDKSIRLSDSPSKALHILNAKHHAYETLLRWQTIQAIEQNSERQPE